MRNKFEIMILASGFFAFLAAICFGQTEIKQVRVGIFDSRAVAVAYAHSDFNKKRMEPKQAEMEKAKAAGDTIKMKQLDEWGKAQQDKLHRQKFGKESVSDMLEDIKNDLPDIAKKAGVDVIVSKWDVVYQNPSAELVDITKELVQPFKSTEKTMKIIESLQKHQPASEEDLEKLEKMEH
jgi:hypothetical protein